MAAMAPERSRTLHNFSLPPRLNWGTQKLLRCSNKLNHNNDAVSTVSSSSSDRKRRNTSSFRTPSTTATATADDDDRIDVIRQKLMLDLRFKVTKMRAAFLSNAPPPPPPPPPPPEPRPWNVRTRRAALSGARVVGPESTTNKASPVRGGGGEREAERRVKFSVALTRQEIEDDFLEIIGRRPPRKPKKRPRNVQRPLDSIFPGLWLTEITADMYKVNETPEPAKILIGMNGEDEIYRVVPLEVFEGNVRRW